MDTTAVASAPMQTVRERLAERLRPFLAAMRLDWQIESNWTDPFVFMTYQVVRPLFGALILVFMFKVVTGQPTSSPTFAHMYVGNAFFILVWQSLWWTGLVVFEDRERYETIRYIYLAPIGLGSYLAARGVARIVVTAISIVLTLAVGAWFFGVDFHMTLAEWPHLALVILLGALSTLAMGILLAGWTLVIANHGYSMPEGVGGVLFLLCGVVFSIDILPAGISHLALAMPWTWWLEALRRILLDAPYVTSISTLTDGTVLGYLTLTTAATTVTAWAVLRGCERLAVAKGKLDEKTDH